MAKRRRKARKSTARRRHSRSHRRMHGLGEMDMAPMMMNGLGQFDYSMGGMSTTTKVVLGAAVVGAAYWFFFRKASPLSKTEIAITKAGPSVEVTAKNAKIVGAVIPDGKLLTAAVKPDGSSVTFTRGAVADGAAAEDFEVDVKLKDMDDKALPDVKVKVNLSGAGYFSGLGNLGRGYYSGWQGQGDPGTDFQAAGRGYNYGRYF